MKHINKFKYRMRERGNVLFLILIAVALFAALSYAVTSSSRTSSGTTDGESNLINSAQITQYPASVRTAVVRMLINGVAVNQLEFNGPNDFATLTNTNPSGTTFGFGVFHPDGGGATLVTAPPEVMENQQPGVWIFNSRYQVSNIGTTVPAANSANEVLAFLPGVQIAACRRLNEELGINTGTTGWVDTDGNGVPGAGITIGNIPTAAMNMIGPQGGANAGIGVAATAARTIGGAFSGQSYGCFDANDATSGTLPNEMVYFHVLMDR